MPLRIFDAKCVLGPVRKPIMEDFRRRTYFATHLEDALGFGGNRVFEVAFDYASLNWQFTLADQIERRNIVRYSVYTVTRKFENRTLSKRIFLSNLAKEKASHQHAERTNHYLESWMQALRDFYARFTNTRIVL